MLIDEVQSLFGEVWNGLWTREVVGEVALLDGEKVAEVVLVSNFEMLGYACTKLGFELYV